MARIDRRPAGRQHRDKGRLRPLQAEGDLEIAVRGHLLEVAVPRLARVETQLFAALPVSRSQVHLTSAAVKGFSVMPFDALAAAERSVRCRPRSMTTQSPDRARSTLGWFAARPAIHNKIVETPIIGRLTAAVDSSCIDIEAGLSKMRHPQCPARLWRAPVGSLTRGRTDDRRECVELSRHLRSIARSRGRPRAPPSCSGRMRGWPRLATSATMTWRICKG